MHAYIFVYREIFAGKKEVKIRENKEEAEEDGGKLKVNAEGKKGKIAKNASKKAYEIYEKRE